MCSTAVCATQHKRSAQTSENTPSRHFGEYASVEMRRASLCGMLRGVSSKGHMEREGGGAVIRQAHLIAVVRVLLIGCAVLLVGCSGAGSEASQEEQGHTEATRHEQGYTEATEREARSPQATASEEARCEKTRTFHRKGYVGAYVTNDVPGCPTGGLLSGTDKPDQLAGKEGDDEIRGLGDQDVLIGGPGNDFLVGGPNREEGHHKSDDVLWGEAGSDVLHGGAGADYLYSYSQAGGYQGKDVLYSEDGNDLVLADDGDEGDKLYCGEGQDRYMADKGDFVSSSCEKKWNGIVY
jgi:hypothetical protein